MTEKIKSLIKRLETVAESNRESCSENCKKHTFGNDEPAKLAAFLDDAVAYTYDDCIAVIRDHFKVKKSEET